MSFAILLEFLILTAISYSFSNDGHSFEIIAPKFLQLYKTVRSLCVAYIIQTFVLIFFSELLSIFGLLTVLALKVFHLLALFFLSLALLRNKAVKPIFQFSKFSSQHLILLTIIAFVIPGFLIGYYAAPNNWDSATYHLPRVMRWLSQGSLQHFSTFVARQLYLSPGAEIILTHVVALSGSDQFVAHLQSFSFLICLCGICASAILTSKSSGKISLVYILVAIVFAATTPIAILQSSSTQNDLVHSAFLILCLQFLIEFKLFANKNALYLAAASAGLAISVKGVAFLILPSFLLFFPNIKNFRIKELFLICSLVLILNIPHWIRNYNFFGHALGPAKGPQHNTSFYKNSDIGLSTTFSNFLRNLTLQVNFPNSEIGNYGKQVVKNIHKIFGLEHGHPKNTWAGTSFDSPSPYIIHEDLVPNPWQVCLFIVCSLTIAFLPGMRLEKRLSLVILLSLLFFCAYLKWQPWHTRILTPIFLISAIPVAAILSRYKMLYMPIVGILLWQAFPIWTENSLRPLKLEPNIFTQNRLQQYFNARPGFHEDFKSVKNFINTTSPFCDSVDYVSAEDHWEYPIYLVSSKIKNIRPCRVEQHFDRYLWEDGSDTEDLANKSCALLWLGGNGPDRLEACDKHYLKKQSGQFADLYVVEEE